MNPIKRLALALWLTVKEEPLFVAVFTFSAIVLVSSPPASAAVWFGIERAF